MAQAAILDLARCRKMQAFLDVPKVYILFKRSIEVKSIVKP